MIYIDNLYDTQHMFMCLPTTRYWASLASCISQSAEMCASAGVLLRSNRLTRGLFAMRFRRRGADESSQLSLSEMGVAGAWAGVMNAPVRQVFERVKGIMQVHHR